MLQTVPTDLKSFEDQSIWLRIYNEMDIPSRTPDWEGTVETLVGDDVLSRPDDIGAEVNNNRRY